MTNLLFNFFAAVSDFSHHLSDVHQQQSDQMAHLLDSFSIKQKQMEMENREAGWDGEDVLDAFIVINIFRIAPCQSYLSNTWELLLDNVKQESDKIV